MTPEECGAALEDCRKKIDAIDRQIVSLLNERAKVVEVIGQVKQQAHMRVYEPKREDAVYANIVDANQGPLKSDAVKRVYERIIDEMRTLQRDRMAAGQQHASPAHASPAHASPAHASPEKDTQS
ncbi:MAG: chorismate mutase [Bryobacterales bacterium]|nr:chorismate mutase [Bryobacterales bacterium]